MPEWARRGWFVSSGGGWAGIRTGRCCAAAGDELCDLVQLLAERVAGPVRLVVTARPELLDQRPGWPAGGSLVRLEALPAADAEQLAVALLGSDCPAPIRELVAERGEGNP